MLLKDKVAIVYGSGGLGRGVALAFAREGAKVFLAARNQKAMDAIAAEVKGAGGEISVGVVDALDEKSVDEHAEMVAAQAGRIDVSFNLISHGDVQGIPLVDMAVADLSRAVISRMSSNFITARAAARHMSGQGSGAILMLTSGSSSGGTPMMGSTSSADAATEALMRSLAAELGPQGIRVVGLWTAGVAETLTAEKIGAVNSTMQLDEAAVRQVIEAIGAMAMLRHAPALADVANTAAFLASDGAGSITGTVVNVTAGLVAR